MIKIKQREEWENFYFKTLHDVLLCFASSLNVMSLAKTDNLSKIYRNPPLFAKEGLELKDTAIRPHENNIRRKQSQI